MAGAGRSKPRRAGFLVHVYAHSNGNPGGFLHHEGRRGKVLTIRDLWGNALPGGASAGSTLIYLSLPGTVEAFEQLLHNRTGK
jgi:hypothetical protein